MKIVFFDTETNGLSKKNSVLSISAIKCDFINDNGIITEKSYEEYNRFYYRQSGEEEGKEAININGLTCDVIKTLRAEATYPLYFRDDMDSFKLFCKGSQRFAGHNISYDRQYISFRLGRTFCTMKSNLEIMQLKRKNGALKFPSLTEAASFYSIQTKKEKLHESMYDTWLVYMIFKKMLESNNPLIKEKAFNFLFL